MKRLSAIAILVITSSLLSTASAQTKNNAVILSWTTTQESTNNYFEVERSFNGKDFSKIGMVLDGFENESGKDYAFPDNAKSLKNKKMVYYRLKQFDTNGSVTYSTAVNVNAKNGAIVTLTVPTNKVKSTDNFLVSNSAAASTLYASK